MSQYSHQGDARFRKLHPAALSSGKFKTGDVVQYIKRLRRKGHEERYKVWTCTAYSVTFIDKPVIGKNFSPEFFERVR